MANLINIHGVDVNAQSSFYNFNNKQVEKAETAQFKAIFNNETKSLDIEVEGVIGWYPIWGQNFRRKVKNSKAERIRLFITSPGGDASDAFQIYTFLKMQSKPVEAYLYGMPASAATVIAAAADDGKCFIDSTALALAHDAWAFYGGVGDDFIAYGEELNKVSDQIARAYKEGRKMSKTIKEIRAIMKKDVFVTAKEYVKLGFADRVVKAEDVGRDFEKTNAPMAANNSVGDAIAMYNINNDKQIEMENSITPEERTFFGEING